MAVTIDETDFTQPLELRLNVEKLVGWIFVFGLDVERGQELVVQGPRRRCHMFEVAEDRARSESREHLFVQLTFARMGQVMNGKTRDDRVEGPKIRWQGEVQIVRDDADARVGREPTSESFDHRPGKIERDSFCGRTGFCV